MDTSSEDSDTAPHSDSAGPEASAIEPTRSGQSIPLGPWVLVLVSLWGVCMYGSTTLHNSPQIGRYLGHGLCGPWGCAARPEALLGYHLFWLTVLVGPGFWLGLRLQTGSGWVLACVLVGGGCGLTVVMAGWAACHCLFFGSESLRPYVWQVIGFAIVTNTDLPAVQIACAGVATAVGRRLGRWLMLGRALPGPAEQSPSAAAGSPATL